MFVMSKSFSKDLRERVVAAYYNGVGTIPKIARLFNLGKSTVDKYLNIHRSTGDLTPGKSTGRPPVLDEKHLSTIKEIVLSSPDKTLQDYCIAFEKLTGKNIPKSLYGMLANFLIFVEKKEFLRQRTGKTRCYRKTRKFY